MNYMRKILSSTGSQGSVDTPTGNDDAAGDASSLSSPRSKVPPSPSPTVAPAPFDQLSLTHLKKLHAEYTSPPHPLADQEKEERLYNMMPLFCKVFANSDPKTVTEKFLESSSLAQSGSRLLVTEVRRRASNQSTEEAASAIATFMQVNDTSEETSNGWMLLSALNIFCVEGAALIEIMTSASVPSTLVKCLYLFFDLPPEDDGETTSSATSSSSDKVCPKKERRKWLQKLFVRLLVRLCSHVPAVEELARKDDLTLLFSAVTSACPKHNVVWRKTASDILLTVSRHSLSPPVISYLHSTKNHGCALGV
jgi:hypothetical protein